MTMPLLQVIRVRKSFGAAKGRSGVLFGGRGGLLKAEWLPVSLRER